MQAQARITDTPLPRIGSTYQLTTRARPAKVIAVAEAGGVTRVFYRYVFDQIAGYARTYSMHAEGFHNLFSGHFEPAENVLRFD